MKTIQSVEKAINIVNFIAKNNGMLNLTEISKELKMSIGTLHGFIATLEKCQMLRKDNETGKYFLGDLVFKYSLLNNPQTSLVNISRPYLDEIRNCTNETVHLAVPANSDEIIYIAKAESRFPFRLTSLVGTVEKAELSAIGLLLYDMKEKVISLESEYKTYKGIEYCSKYEPDLDAYCFAAKFQYSANNNFAGISVVVPKVRLLTNTEMFYVEPLVDKITELQNELLSLPLSSL